MMWLNVGCGTHRAPQPWWNIDVVDKDEVEGYGSIHPDEVVPRGPLPYEDGSCEKVMLSHVLEHVPWARVLDFLGEMRRVMVDGGTLYVIGPDWIKAVQRWRDGLEPWEIVDGILEHARGRGDIDGPWPEARHHWNCSEERMMLAVKEAGFIDVTAYPVPSPEVDTWATAVTWAPWQSAVKATR